MKNLNHKFLSFFVFLTLFCFAFLFFNTLKVFASTVVTDNIETNTEWTLSGSPYIVKNSIEISLGATLTIDPGVIVKFAPVPGGGFTVFGNLIANGDENNKIYFTSNYDDTVGGDTAGDYYCYEDVDENGNDLGQVCDGSGLLPKEDDWEGIDFFDSHNNSIKNTVIGFSDDAFYLNHSELNLKNVDISDSSTGLFANNGSILDADNVNANNLSDVVLYNIDYSTVNWVNSKIDNIDGDALSVFDSSTLNLSNFSIKNITNGEAVYLFSDSTLTADKLQIENISGNVGYGVSIFNDSHFTLKNSSIKNCPDGACLLFTDWDEYSSTPSIVDIENSTLDGGTGSGILAYGSTNLSATIKNSTIENFTNYSIENYASFTIHAENNWWGNDAGPYQVDKNPNGIAGSIFNPMNSENVDFVPWCKNEKCSTHNPVILVPGIMGSEIFKSYDDNSQIWPNINKLLSSISDSFLDDLILNPDGTENDSKPMKLGDIIKGTKINVLGYEYESHTFDGLIDELEKDGYKENTDLFVFPYDWRKSNIESAEKLKDKINDVLTQTGADKVDIVAHSMGGLVAKKYIADNGGDKIGQLIFVGTPHLGAPKAFKALMYGDDMGIGADIDKFSIRLHFLNLDEVKKISQNMPGVYELLPSKKYVDGQDGFLGQKYFSSSGSNELDYSKTEDFLTDQGKNKNILINSENLHTDIDNLDMKNINVTNFSGCGNTKTVGEIILSKKKSWTSLWLKDEDDVQINYVNGDDTVPLHSSIDSTGIKYYVKGSTHGELPSASGLKEDVTSILENKQLTNFDNVSSDIDTCFVSGKVVSTHSPVELNIYDESGNHTGPNTDGDIEENIPGVQYDVIEGEKFAFLPDGANYKIVTNAMDTGGYNFQIKNEDKNDNITNTFDWTLIPLETLQAEGQIWVGPNYPESGYEVKMDEDGDGNVDKTFPVSFNGITLAEEAISSPSSQGGHSYGGMLINKEQIEPIAQIGAVKNEILSDSETKIEPVLRNINKTILVQNNLVSDKSENIPLIAEVGKSGFKIDKIWFIIIGAGFVLGLLAKRFLKR